MSLCWYIVSIIGRHLWTQLILSESPPLVKRRKQSPPVMSLGDNPTGAAWKLELSSFLCVFNVCHLCSFLTLWWDFIWSIAIILKWKDLLKNPCCCRHKLVSSLCFVLLIFLSFIVLLWSSAWEQEPSSWLTLLAQIVLEKICWCWRSGSPQLTQKQSQQPEEWC